LHAAALTVGSLGSASRSGGSVPPNAVVSDARFGVAHVVLVCVGAARKRTTPADVPARASAVAVVFGVSEPSKSAPTSTAGATSPTAARTAASVEAYCAAVCTVGAGPTTR
jgi:hypothetical protein